MPNGLTPTQTNAIVNSVTLVERRGLTIPQPQASLGSLYGIDAVSSVAWTEQSPSIAAERIPATFIAPETGLYAITYDFDTTRDVIYLEANEKHELGNGQRIEFLPPTPVDVTALKNTIEEQGKLIQFLIDRLDEQGLLR